MKFSNPFKRRKSEEGFDATDKDVIIEHDESYDPNEPTPEEERAGEKITDRQRKRDFDHYAKLDKKFPADWDRNSSGGRGKKRVGRLIARILLTLLFLILLLGSCSKPKVDYDKTASPDQITAGNFAAGLSKEFFTYDADNPGERKDRLRPYNPAYGANVGWDGKGKQTITNTTVVQSKKVSDSQYDVTVKMAVQDSPTPLYSEMAVWVQNGTYSPMSYPAIVASPELPIPNYQAPQHESDSDQQANADVKDRLGVFFKAWGEGDTSTLQAVTSTDYKASPILSGQKFDSMDNFKLFYADDAKKADSPDRLAQMSVKWNSPNGSQITSFYQVSVTNDNGRWLVTKVDAANPNTSAFISDRKDLNSADDTASATPTATDSASATPSSTATSGE